ncbi:MAG: hypothetical protein LBT41_00925 [Candidatus Methanoplasma sp.]|jgi:hypothetical membrane protein|nr:hypothetical protein [Candidatus Methanoplasma sp.]
MEVEKWHNVAFAWAGIFATVSFAIFITLATNVDSWVFGEDLLSTLRHSDNVDARIFLNLGCVFSGLLLVTFGTGNILYHRNHDQSVGGGLVAIAGIVLIFIGLITADLSSEVMYNYLEGAFATLMLLSMAVFAAGNWVADHKVFAGISMILFASGVATVVTFSFEMMEAIGICIGLIWIVIESVRLMIEKPNAGGKVGVSGRVRQ